MRDPERELSEITEGRQKGPATEFYDRNELPVERQGYIACPLFCGKCLFGLLISGIDGRWFAIGEFLSFQRGRAIFMKWVFPEKM